LGSAQSVSQVGKVRLSTLISSPSKWRGGQVVTTRFEAALRRLIKFDTNGISDIEGALRIKTGTAIDRFSTPV
jgi:hypothetical protein